ncbi:MAG: endonuclease-3, partial [Maricaulis maris]
MPASAAKPKKRKPRQPRGLNREQAHDLMARLAQDHPDPKTELDYTNPYTLLVAVALSAQATDVGVNKATRLLFQEADTPEKMVALGEDHVRDRVK